MIWKICNGWSMQLSIFPVSIILKKKKENNTFSHFFSIIIKMYSKVPIIVSKIHFGHFCFIMDFINVCTKLQAFKIILFIHLCLFINIKFPSKYYGYIDILLQGVSTRVKLHHSIYLVYDNLFLLYSGLLK